MRAAKNVTPRTSDLDNYLTLIFLKFWNVSIAEIIQKGDFYRVMQ